MLLGAGLVVTGAEAQLTKGSRFESTSGCVRCHAEVGQNIAVPHAPLAEGDCSSCHKPHGLIGALRLQKDEPDLCLDCHDTAVALDAEHRAWCHAVAEESA